MSRCPSKPRPPAELRRAVVRSDVEEFSYEEISRSMGCPIGTVMSRLHRGRKLLQGSLYNHAVALGIVKGEQRVGGAVANDDDDDDESVAKTANLSDYRARAKKRGAL